MNIDPKLVDLLFYIVAGIVAMLLGIIGWIARGVTRKLDKMVESSNNTTNQVVKLTSEMSMFKQNLQEIPKITERTIRTESELHQLKQQFGEIKTMVTQFTTVLTTIQQDFLTHFLNEFKNHKKNIN